MIILIFYEAIFVLNNLFVSKSISLTRPFRLCGACFLSYRMNEKAESEQTGSTWSKVGALVDLSDKARKSERDTSKLKYASSSSVLVQSLTPALFSHANTPHTSSFACFHALSYLTAINEIMSSFTGPC